MRTNRITLAASLLLLLCAAASCPPQPNAGQLQNTIAIMDATVPLAVAATISQQPDTAPYFRAAADVADRASGSTNITAQQIIADIRALNGNQYAELAVLGGVALWQAYVAQYPADTEGARLLLRTLAVDIRAGLPPATVQSVKGFNSRKLVRR